MGNQNYIVINGKKYDAITGRQLSDGSNGTHKLGAETAASRPMARTSAGVVDGFTRAKPKRSSHAQINPVTKNQQRSQTLARKAVQKPNNITPKTKPQHPGISKNTLGVSPRRVYMAKEIQKSPQIQKYGVDGARSSVVKKNIQAPVKQAPNNQGVTQTRSANSSYSNTQYNTSRVNQSSNHQQRTSSMIENALANAKSHEQQAPPKQKKKRTEKLAKKLGVSRRTIAISSAALAGALLIGFFAIQNAPNISMRIAATRAGFDAQLPAYTPSGFSFKGPINYEPGRVTVTFKSNSDQRSYSVVQQSSNWNSDALVANFMEPENKQYQTYLDRGRTLYIYDGSNATWIDDGIWYQIEGESGMTTDQLIRLAASI